MATVVLGTDSTEGPLVQLTGPLSPPVVNAWLQQAEAGQPEGAQLSLTIQSLGAWAPLAADYLNTQFAQGAITDPATGEALQAWPGATQIAYADASTGQLELQWVKGQPWAWILVGMLVAGIVAYLFYQALANAPWQMAAHHVPTPTAQTPGGFVWFGGNPFRIMGLPWYWVVGGVVVLGGGTWVLHRVVQASEDIETERELVTRWEGRA